jgi:hypothetical protein
LAALRGAYCIIEGTKVAAVGRLRLSARGEVPELHGIATGNRK